MAESGAVGIPPQADVIAVLDFGSQYAQLIARRVRELSCYAEIVMPADLPKRIGEAQGVIFSGSPWSAYDEEKLTGSLWVKTRFGSSLTRLTLLVHPFPEVLIMSSLRPTK